MRIVLSSAGPLEGRIGGGQVYVQNLATELASRGHHLTIIAPHPWQGQRETASIHRYLWNGIQVLGIAVDDRRLHRADAWSEMPAPLLRVLEQVARDANPQVMHLHGMKPALTKIAVDLGIPHAITAHHGGFVCPAGALLRPDDSVCDLPMNPGSCVSCYCSQIPKSKWIGSALGTLPRTIYRSAGVSLNVLRNPTYAGRVLMYPWLIEHSIAAKQFALRNAQRIIAPSKAIAGAIRRNGVSDERITVIPHGITPFSATPITGLGRRPLRFGYVGTINRPKGVRILLEAFARLSPGSAELHIVGAPQRAEEQAYHDEAMARLRGRADVILRGAVSRDQIEQEFAGFDVLVVPSIYLEVFGLVILEAFSAGRPVIVTDSGGPSEIVRNGVDGIVVPPNDVAALWQAMRELTEHPQRVAEMAAHIRPVRTLAEHVDDLESLYADLIGAKSKARGPQHLALAGAGV